MQAWTHTCMDEHMDTCRNAWTHTWTRASVHAWTKTWTHTLARACADECIGACMHGRAHGCILGRMGARMNACINARLQHGTCVHSLVLRACTLEPYHALRHNNLAVAMPTKEPTAIINNAGP
eukprot:108190-Chlamydomonas_euryale.AAC.5